MLGAEHITKQLLSTAALLSMLLMFLCINHSVINAWIINEHELLSFIILTIFFLNLVVSKSIKPDRNSIIQSDVPYQLFNLFYINTSKVHEIVMLIDNKIMKTVEREQVSEELLKYSSSLSIGVSEKWSSETGYLKEDNSKKRVYESFDVKTTKSIMLRKIYETTQVKKDKQANLKLGDLTIFENIELMQRNIDDTVMILNILQDSKFKMTPMIA